MNEFKLTGNIYVSKSGSDANPGTDPNNPKLTIASAVLAATTGQTIIVGSGLYQEDNITVGISKEIIADGIVVMSGLAGQTCFIASDRARFVGLIFSGYTTNINTPNANSIRQCVIEDCVFNGGNVILRANGAGTLANAIRCKFINCQTVQGADRGTDFFEQKRMIGCICIGCNILDFVTLESCYVDATSTISLDATVTSQIINSNIRTSSISNATLVNVIDVNPLFLGDPVDLEFTVSATSPMIAAGINAVNIGDVKIGSLQNEGSVEWGINPESAGNTAFGLNGELTLTSGSSSNRDSDQIDLGTVRNSPFIRLNGLVDYLNNVPDTNNTLVNPNHLVFAAQWAGEDGIFNGTWRLFRWNENLQLDINGASNGETNFDWGNLVDIQLRYIKIRTTVRNDYNVA